MKGPITEFSKGKVTRDDVALILTEGHLSVYGGYPYDYDWFGDTLVVASLLGDLAENRQRTCLDKYEATELDRLVEFANKYLDEAAEGNHECSKEEALRETIAYAQCLLYENE